MNKLTIGLKHIVIIISTIMISLFPGLDVYAQQPETLSIQQVYQLARNNYPLIKQKDLITKTKDYSVSNAAKRYLPVFSVNGQATYQSTVTSFPFQVPGIKIPEFSSKILKCNCTLCMTG